MTTVNKFRSFLAASIAIASFAAPAISFAQSSSVLDESVDVNGVIVGIDGGYSIPRGHEYGGNLEEGLNALHAFAGYRFADMFELEASFMDIESPIKGSDARALTRVFSIDSRFFVLGAGAVQPNFLLGYAPVADLHYATGFGNVTEHGYSINVGAGVRVAVVRHLYLTADFRHMFIRHTKGDLQSGGTTFSGTFEHEQKGDIGTLLLGGGFQF